MHSRIRALKAVVFFLIGLVLFGVLQNIMTPDWSDADNTNYIIHGLEALEEDNIDILFLGTSHMEQGISPMKLYEDTKIRSYSLASSIQPIECSYYMLKKALETQSPKVVVLDVSSLFFQATGSYNAAWRYLLDNMPLSELKLEMAETYGDKTYGDGFWTAVFPFLKYHSRWDELRKTDFKTIKPGSYYSAGQFLVTEVAGSSWTVDYLDADVNYLLQLNNGGRITSVTNGEIQQIKVFKPVYMPDIAKENLEWLLKIQSICEERGAELLLVKVPVMKYPQEYGSAWTRVKSNLVSNIAVEHGIPFLDYLYGADIGIDLTTDSRDGGVHLNFRGAEKLTASLGSYLMEHYGLQGCTDLQYERMLSQYKAVREIAMLQSETSFNAYIERLLQSKEDWTIYIAARDEYTAGMQDVDYALLEELGLQIVRKGEYRDSYLAVVDRGAVKYETMSNLQIDYKMTMNGLPVVLSSSGWNTTSLSRIKIGGIEYSTGTRGLNIVVYDNASKMVVDSVAFDTCSQDKPATRNWNKVSIYFRKYETATCFIGG